VRNHDVVQLVAPPRVARGTLGDVARTAAHPDTFSTISARRSEKKLRRGGPAAKGEFFSVP
jgi:hypothetical protein